MANPPPNGTPTVAFAGKPAGPGSKTVGVAPVCACTGCITIAALPASTPFSTLPRPEVTTNSVVTAVRKIGIRCKSTVNKTTGRWNRRKWGKSKVTVKPEFTAPEPSKPQPRSRPCHCWLRWVAPYKPPVAIAPLLPRPAMHPQQTRRLPWFGKRPSTQPCRPSYRCGQW